MEDINYEEHYYDVEDTYVATIKNLKRKTDVMDIMRKN